MEGQLVPFRVVRGIISMGMPRPVSTLSGRAAGAKLRVFIKFNPTDLFAAYLHASFIQGNKLHGQVVSSLEVGIKHKVELAGVHYLPRSDSSRLGDPARSQNAMHRRRDRSN